MSKLTTFHAEIAEIADGPCPYPDGRFSGSGIVTCAGGRSYFPCAWVLANLLRSLGCCLPVEVWYRGRPEMNEGMRRLLESVEGVQCVDAHEMLRRFPSRLRNGWEIKPYSIIHSRFEEVLFIDCDNVPVRDPSFLLRARPYRQQGAIFWPDRWMAEGDNENYRTLRPEAWEASGVARRNEPEFESGQMVIDKRRCWKALRLAMFFNEHSDFFYEWLLGDKDTFHMAWRRLGQEYAMPPFRPAQDWADGPVIYQHDFRGRRQFQHRNEDKWSYDGANLRIPGFRHEKRCLEYIEELRHRWDGIVRRYPEDYSPAERSVYETLTATRLFSYGRGGAGSRLIELRPDFQIGIGKEDWETHWGLEESADDGTQVIIRSTMRKMATLTRTRGGAYAGRRLHFDRAPVALEPISRLPSEERKTAEQLRKLLPGLPDQDGEEVAEIAATRLFAYHRVGHDSRPMEFRRDHTIGEGAAGCERWWYVDAMLGSPEVVIGGDYGPICRLTRQGDRSWAGTWSRFEKMQIELIPQSEAHTRRRHIYDP